MSALVNYFLPFLGIPMLGVFVASFYYSRAILFGLACARDEQHRMTPLSPWYFFMREFKPRGIWIAIGFVLWAVGETSMIEHVMYAYYVKYSIGFENVLSAFEFVYYSLHVGMICGAFAFITLLAPRFKSPMAVALIGAVIGPLPHLCLIFSVAFNNFFIQDFLDDTYLFLTGGPSPFGITWLFVYQASLFLIGPAALVLTWLYVRFVLNRAWFRFDS